MRHPISTLRGSTCLLLMLFSLGGCRAACVDRGAALYADGDYVGAAEVFEHNEAQLQTASPQERARYALYRGITLQSLGDAERSAYWLELAANASERESDLFDASERATLSRALQTNAVHSSRLARNGREGDGKVTAVAAAP